MPRLLVLGIMTAPRNAYRRLWYRNTTLPAGPAIRLQFVLGTEGYSPDVCSALANETSRHRDMVFVDAVDNGALGCIEKTLFWLIQAVREYPSALWFAKTDDDSFNHYGNLEVLLRSPPFTRRPFVYGGWVQFSSFLPAVYQPCGWSASGRSARLLIESNTSTCHECSWCFQRGAAKPTREPLNQTIHGPFPFATGALELFSAPLARAAFGSAWLAAFVAEGKVGARTLPGWEHWECHKEDTIVGYVIHRAMSDLRLGANSTLVSLGGIVRDALDARWAPSTAELEQYLVLHKLEPDESVLVQRYAFEDAEEVRFKRRGIPVVRHKRDHALMNRRLRPQLDLLVRAQMRAWVSGRAAGSALRPSALCYTAKSTPPGQGRGEGKRERHHAQRRWQGMTGLFELAGYGEHLFCDVTSGAGDARIS